MQREKSLHFEACSERQRATIVKKLINNKETLFVVGDLNIWPSSPSEMVPSLNE